MFLDINKIGPEGLVLDHRLDLPDLEDSAGQPVTDVTARVRGEARRGSRGVDLSARIEATARMRCSRCLGAVHEDIATDFLLILVPGSIEPAADRDEVKDADVALFHAEDGKASVREIATEQIHLNLPLKPICRDDCQGLCPACGADRNVTECGCKEPVDPRLAPLLRLDEGRGES